jgi:polyisoprenoid-binding protein YceI
MNTLPDSHRAALTRVGSLARLRRKLTLGVLAGALLAPGAGAEPVRYEIDPEHLSVGFLVDHIGYARVLGMFRTAQGSFRFDEDRAELSEVQVEIDTESVFSNHQRRDEHLRSADFLDVREHPRMVFSAAGAERVSEREFLVRGELTLLGVTRPVTLEATWNKSDTYPIGGMFSRPYVMGVSLRGSFRRSEFGMTYGVDNGWVGDEVELIIELEAKRR